MVIFYGETLSILQTAWLNCSNYLSLQKQVENK